MADMNKKIEEIVVKAAGVSIIQDADTFVAEDEWTQEREDLAKSLLEQDRKVVAEFWQNKYEKEAAKNWDLFYKRNTTNFYKDRHYLHVVFPDLGPHDDDPEKVWLLEVGCGVGNAALPLLEVNSRLNVVAIDFADKAVDLFQQQPLFDASRCHVSVCDITKDPLPSIIDEEGGVNFALFMFCLSALHPDKMQEAVNKIVSAVKPGGKIFFRDYGRYDQAQLRFKPGHKLADNFYVRQDNTRAYYFTTEEIRDLFIAAGMEECENEYIRRQYSNRSQGVVRFRMMIIRACQRPLSMQGICRGKADWNGARSDVARSWKSGKSDTSRSWKSRDGPKRSEFPKDRKTFKYDNDTPSVPVVPGEALHGIHGVHQALRCNMRVFHKLMLRDTNSSTKSASKKISTADDKDLKEIKRLAEEQGIPVSYESKWTLNRLTNDKPHQGVILFAEQIELPQFNPQEPNSVSNGKPPVILALDEIHDAQNFGAVLRSAYFLGVHSVLTSSHNNAPLSAAVLRASVGASEVLAHENRLYETPNMHQALATSQQLGWNIVGACSGSKAVSSAAYSITKPTIIVVGNEHRGLKPAIRRCCDEILTIPGASQEETSKVDSLNVSVATGILLYQLLQL